MDRKLDAHFLSRLRNLGYELEEMLAQALDRDIAVFVQLAQEARAVIDSLARGHPVDEVSFQLREFAFGP